MTILETLTERGLRLPPAPAAGGVYVAARQHGSLLYLAGVISIHEGKIITGRLGQDISIEQGAFAAQCCVLQQLAVIHDTLGDLDRVSRVISVNGYVRCVPEFSDPPKVVDGASLLLVDLWGEAGKHVRAAVGVASLPKAAAVEIQMTVEVREAA